jgi:dTDP-4-dehydrorhamnose 3,5-epimerase
MFTETGIKDLLIFQPKVYKDNRGYFYESYNKKIFLEAGIIQDFVQDNQSKSTYGVLRGLHFQTGEHAQAKLVRVLEGRVLDVAVDIRPNSATFGQSFSIELSAENNTQLYIPRSFAHGFVVLSETAVFSYKCDNYYSKEAESGIIYNDPDLKINWQVDTSQIKVNARDNSFKKLRDLAV